MQQIQASDGSFAAILSDGSVVTWGNAGFSGDCSAGKHQLRNVQQIQTSGGAFAAILGAESVVTLGCGSSGGFKFSSAASAAACAADPSLQRWFGCHSQRYFSDRSAVSWG